MVTAPRRSRRAATASAQISPCWRASASSDPSSASTTSRTVSSSAARANEYPPFTPRCELRIPARLSVANSPSRNWTGMSRRRAISPMGTGPAPPLRASSASARTAYGAFDVIASISATRLSVLDSEPPPIGPVAAAARADGGDLLLLRAARPELGARDDRSDRAQDRAHGGVRAALLPLVARPPDGGRAHARHPAGARDHDRLRVHGRAAPALRARSPRDAGRRGDRLGGRRRGGRRYQTAGALTWRASRSSPHGRSCGSRCCASRW